MAHVLINPFEVAIPQFTEALEQMQLLLSVVGTRSSNRNEFRPLGKFVQRLGTQAIHSLDIDFQIIGDAVLIENPLAG